MLSSQLRCLSAPAVTDEVSAEANKLHLKCCLASLSAARSGLERKSKELLFGQAADDGCEHDLQFSLPAAHPGLCSGFAPTRTSESALLGQHCCCETEEP